jgi:hypothetical protein
VIWLVALTLLAFLAYATGSLLVLPVWIVGCGGWAGCSRSFSRTRGECPWLVKGAFVEALLGVVICLIGVAAIVIWHVRTCEMEKHCPDNLWDNPDGTLKSPRSYGACRRWGM